ncbi:hypothetical protein [Aureimonas sp. SK2]|uniref:hypothetical protein n=1 Tax=Aureimonas sp. SK2 TaxID=3015992 RepID=UPI002444EAE9|nr:hypothetical protein [Aureimonas sp. SK2]
MTAAPTPEQLAALMVVAASASPEAVAEAEEFETDIPPPEMDDFELAEAAEAGVYIPGLLDEIRRRAALLTDDELLSVEPFEGDDGDVRVLSSKVVRGRWEHRDHWSGMPIPKGELHVVRGEVCDGEFLTTRHSRETIWMAWAGGFGSQELGKQVSP